MTETTALVPLADTMELGKVLAQSGFFADAKEASKAVVKVLAGRELGFGPIASMTGVNIIQGKPAIGANLIAAKVKGSGKYTFREVELTDEACELAFFEGGQEIGRSRFTMEDAQRAGLNGKDNWKKYPRNMLFARAISNGARWYCPDAFSGVTVYTPDELGAEVNGDGDIIDVTPVRVETTEPEGKTNGHTYDTPQARAESMRLAINEKLGQERYQHIKHLHNAICLEAGDQDWTWPELDDEDGWRAAYNLALSYARKETPQQEMAL